MVRPYVSLLEKMFDELNLYSFYLHNWKKKSCLYYFFFSHVLFSLEKTKMRASSKFYLLSHSLSRIFHQEIIMGKGLESMLETRKGKMRA